jgi:hypothetical protein
MPDRDLTRAIEKSDKAEVKELAKEETEFKEIFEGKHHKKDEGAPKLESPEHPKAPPKPSETPAEATEGEEVDLHVAQNPVDAHAPVWHGREPNGP